MMYTNQTNHENLQCEGNILDLGGNSWAWYQSWLMIWFMLSSLSLISLLPSPSSDSCRVKSMQRRGEKKKCKKSVILSTKRRKHSCFLKMLANMYAKSRKSEWQNSSWYTKSSRKYWTNILLHRQTHKKTDRGQGERWKTKTYQKVIRIYNL